MIYDQVWKEINYEAMTDYLNKIKAKASIVSSISHWNKKTETKWVTYADYVSKLLDKVADELKAKVTEETTVLVIPVELLPILYFAESFERTAPEAICGPYFAGVVCHSASVIVDIDCNNELFVYNINEPEKVLKLEILE